MTRRIPALLALALASPARAAASPEEAPADRRVNLEFSVTGDLVSHPIWGVELQVPGYEAWDRESLRSLLARPNFVMAAGSRQTCHLPVTMWVERVPAATTAEQCRRGFVGNPEPIRKDKNARLIEDEVSPTTYTLFDILLDKDNSLSLLNHQLYGYWVRGDHCFELHVSSIDCQGFADQAMTILRSVRISGETGATLETVAMAKQVGCDPRDWRAHLAVAGLYLHGERAGRPEARARPKPRDLELARSFYESALRLGGTVLGVDERWLIEEGIAIAWLHGDDGGNALPHLERALELAPGTRDPGVTGRETLYNLVCAEALRGHFEIACGRLRELLSALTPEERRVEMKDVQDDRQLKALRKADCYRSLKTEFMAR